LDNRPGKAPPMASAQQVEEFLKQVRRTIADPKKFVIIPREKNRRDVARLGLVPRQEIMNLTHQDYDRGPLPDEDERMGGVVWEFMKEIDGIWVYMKLKLDERGCVCLSFHEEELGLRSLPYRRMD